MSHLLVPNFNLEARTSYNRAVFHIQGCKVLYLNIILKYIKVLLLANNKYIEYIVQYCVGDNILFKYFITVGRELQPNFMYFTYTIVIIHLYLRTLKLISKQIAQNTNSLEENCIVQNNKPGTAQVGAISKAPK